MSIYENIANGKYNNTKEYPSHSYYNNLMKHGVDRMDEYRQKINEYGEEKKRLTELFWSDIEDEFGTKNHTLKNSFRSYAWEQGHSGGYSEILNVYSDLVYYFADPLK